MGPMHTETNTFCLSLFVCLSDSCHSVFVFLHVCLSVFPPPFIVYLRWFSCAARPITHSYLVVHLRLYRFLCVMCLPFGFIASEDETLVFAHAQQVPHHWAMSSTLFSQLSWVAVRMIFLKCSHDAWSSLLTRLDLDSRNKLVDVSVRPFLRHQVWAAASHEMRPLNE